MPTPRQPPRFVAYARVSTIEQAQEGVSLEAQERRLRAWAEAHEAELVDVVVDEGASAKTLDRPGLRRVLEALREGAATGLVVCKLDRLTRSTRDLLGLVDDLFQRQNLRLVSIAESVDTTTAAGRLVLTVLGALATWERETIGERTAEALAHLRSKGVRVGRAAYGWRYSSDIDEEGRRVVVPVAEEQDVIARARQLRQSGLTLRGIADRLGAEGLKTKRGGRWHAKTVRSLIG